MTTRAKATLIVLCVVLFGAVTLFLTIKSISRRPVKLEMRVFRVDKTALYTAIENVTHSRPNETDDAQTVSVAMRKFFKTVGIDLSAPGRNVAFNDRQGLLFVKATASELNSIEHAVQSLSWVGPQIHVKARFIEVLPDALKSILKAGTMVAETETNTVGIISSDKFKPLMRQLENGGAETWAEPEVVTTSGRQTQMRVGAGSYIIPFQKSAIGPTIDLVPNVLADGYTINLKLIPELLQFDQYDSAPTVPGLTASNAVALPHFTVHEMVTTVNIWDNQTVVLGKGVETTNGSTLFANAGGNNSVTNKVLIIFITATVVDPAGNRVHSDDELRLIEKKNAIPPQN